MNGEFPFTHGKVPFRKINLVFLRFEKHWINTYLNLVPSMVRITCGCKAVQKRDTNILKSGILPLKVLEFGL
jgi:hypothetical protein